MLISTLGLMMRGYDELLIQVWVPPDGRMVKSNRFCVLSPTVNCAAPLSTWKPFMPIAADAATGEMRCTGLVWPAWTLMVTPLAP